MLRQRQICSRQRYGGRGKINKTINTISIGDGFFFKKPRPRFVFSCRNIMENVEKYDRMKVH